eukprot:scaffold24670_cov18-Tisochrysis_lutea.AAC.2
MERPVNEVDNAARKRKSDAVRDVSCYAVFLGSEMHEGAGHACPLPRNANKSRYCKQENGSIKIHCQACAILLQCQYEAA